MAKLFMVVDIGDSIINTNNIKANITLGNTDDDVLAIYEDMPVAYLPNEKTLDSDEYWNMYAGGWNDCLIEIKAVNE